MKTQLEGIAKRLAKASLEMKSIKISTDKPFTWTSGAIMPIYVNNRDLLGNVNAWGLALDGLADILTSYEVKFDVVGGVAKAGMPHAAVLARDFGLGFSYVSDKAKEHGMKSQIEGAPVKGKRVILIEDTISTGQSAAKAVQAIRDAGGTCDHVISIFNYGFEKTARMFQGLERYGEVDDPQHLRKPCKVNYVLSYEPLIKAARESGHIKELDLATLTDWRKNPFGWAEEKGFTKEEVASA